jgi:hypothetical protein
MPTQPPTTTSPQRSLLRTIRQSQAAVLDTIHTWTTITEQLPRTLRLPAPDVDFAGTVDHVFDLAEQTLAAQRQLALTLAGVATRQVDTAVETADTAVAAVQTTVGAGVRRVKDVAHAPEAGQDQPQTPTAESPNQDRKFDGRTYEERTLEELRERASQLQIEGRSAMTKDELITALRHHAK